MDIREKFKNEFALKDKAQETKEKAARLREAAHNMELELVQGILKRSGFEGKVVKFVSSKSDTLGVLRAETIGWGYDEKATIRFYPLTKKGVASKNYSYECSAFERFFMDDNLEKKLDFFMKSYEVVEDYKD